MMLKIRTCAFSKILAFSLIFAFFMTSFSFAQSMRDKIYNLTAYNEMEVDISRDYITKYKENISKHQEFRLWNEGSVDKRIELYNSEKEISAYLYNVMINEDIIGYMIVNAEEGTLLEFAEGESPYSSYLDKYIEVNEDEFIGKKTEKIYNGPSQYGILVSEDGGNINIDKYEIFFTNDPETTISFDASEGVEKHKDLNESIEPMMTITSSSSKTISGVDDYTVTDACGPAAGVNIARFWIDNGYNINRTNQEIDDRLYTLMSAFSVPGGHAVLPKDFRTGLKDYFHEFNHTNFYVSQYNWSYDILRNNVNLNRPGALVYDGSNQTYGAHYVTYIGYLEDFDSGYGAEDYYVIRDGWSSTSINVYRNAEDDESSIVQMFTVSP